MMQSFIIKPKKINLRFNDFLFKTEKELSVFFGININKPNIFFLDSRKDIDKVWGKKTENWFSAWAQNDNIYILNPKFYAKESNHKINHF